MRDINYKGHTILATIEHSGKPIFHIHGLDSHKISSVKSEKEAKKLIDRLIPDKDSES